MKNTDPLKEALKDKPEVLRKVEEIETLAAKHGLSRLEAFRRVAGLINNKAKQNPQSSR